MATYEERFKIVRDAQINPDEYADDVALQAVYPDTTKADVTAARTFYRRVQAALVDVANEQLALSPGPDNNAAILWAQAAIRDSSAEGLRVLQILLARFDAQTPAQILDPVGVVTDAALATELVALVPQLSLGVTRR